MHLLAVSENEIGKPAAKQLEADLIHFAQADWPETCTNKAADARGQVMGINFMYMVVYDGFLSTMRRALNPMRLLQAR